MKYLITGKNGQLARAFLKRFEDRSICCVAPDESLLDITDAHAVAEAVAAQRPDVIINCAAYNLVDKAEREQGIAFAVNAEGPRHLARAARKQGAYLVHFGSDYVFDGGKENGLYTEDDPVNPLNEYGKSKLTGEQYARQEHDRVLLLRLSWVFGEGNQNFVHKLLEWSGGSPFLKVTCDEFSVPTYTETVVDVALRAIEQGITGTYHLTNSGFCSRYEWAKLILRQQGIVKFIRPVTMDAFDLPARRPAFSAMSNTRVSELLNIGIPTWEEAVTSFLEQRGRREARS